MYRCASPIAEQERRSGPHLAIEPRAPLLSFPIDPARNGASVKSKSLAVSVIAVGAVAFSGVTVASAAAAECVQGPAFYTSKYGSRACFKPNGDLWETKDTASDGDSSIAWVISQGSSGGPALMNSNGYGTWSVDSLANLAEGAKFYLRACTQDVSEGGNIACGTPRIFTNNNQLAANKNLDATSV
jgi:hypothetical protein